MQKYIELAGGENNALKNARDAYAQADYRWAAEILKHIVLNNLKTNKQKTYWQIRIVNWAMLLRLQLGVISFWGCSRATK